MDICDFHSHILPKADHGSSSVETSVEQIRLAKSHGVSRIVSTCHFYPQREDVKSFLERRNRCFENLLPQIKDEGVDIKLGAEVLICDNIDRLPSLKELCIGKSNTLLLELPFTDFDRKYCDYVANMLDDGIFVLLAHADRYEEKNIDLLLQIGAKIQLNVTSLDVMFRQKHLYKWMEKGFVYAIGSDIHKADKKAYKHFENAKKKISDFLPYIKEKSDMLWDLA